MSEVPEEYGRDLNPGLPKGVPSQRYKLTIAYRGTSYKGWQFQTVSNSWKKEIPKDGVLPTIQGVLTDALQIVLGHPVTVCGSSRTDTGVHAKGQVAHFDTTQVTLPANSLVRAVNERLPGDIVIREIAPVPKSFNAIRDAVEKRYQYYVWNDEMRNPMLADFAFHRWHKLDVEAMRSAAARIQGTHDFSSFAKPKHVRVTTTRTVTECSVSTYGPRLVIGVRGSGFLWNMVRIIAGTVLEVGLGKYKPEDVDAMLEAKDRKRAGSTAPAEGLYLQWIRFKEGNEAQRQYEERRPEFE